MLYQIRNGTVSFGADVVLDSINFEVKGTEKVAVVGRNGCGKSTLLKTIMGRLPALGGSVRLGHQVTIGYFDQQAALSHTDKTVLDEFWDEFPEMTQTEARTLLGTFLFFQDDVFKRVNMLSGGERGRLALAKLLKRRPNLLILDEPTNHMDIVGKEALEQMIKQYTGTVLFVSHDRFFVERVADSLLVFGTDASVRYYPYGYAEYEQVQAVVAIKSNAAGTGAGTQADSRPLATEPASGNNDYLRRKELARRARRLVTVERLVEECEGQITALCESMEHEHNVSDYIALTRIQDEIDLKQQELDTLLAEWEDLSGDE